MEKGKNWTYYYYYIMEYIKYISINKIVLQEFSRWISTDSLTLQDNFWLLQELSILLCPPYTYTYTCACAYTYT